MRAYAFLQLALALLEVTAGSNETARLFIRKCCDKYKMLSEDWKCVRAPWPPKASVQIDKKGFVRSPADSEWVARWLPPGILLRDHDLLQVNNNNSVTFHFGMTVNKSYLWDEYQILDKHVFEGRVVFWKNDYIIRPTTRGVRIISNYCVDAVKSPLGLFGLLFKTQCLFDDSAVKCCDDGKVLVEKHGKWECTADDRRQFSPLNSSFREDFDPETPVGAGLSRHCSYLRLATPEDRSAYWKHYRNVGHQFATWIPCLDLYENDTILDEGLFYCGYPRLARALWMYFHLIAAWFWLTALCANMVLSFGIQAPYQRRDSTKRFLVFSAFAWGLPALLTTTCFFLFNPTSSQIKYLGVLSSQWYTPTLLEARVCYKEQTVVDGSYKPQTTLKYGTFLFYYGPVVCLVLCNLVCLTRTLRKVQYLSKGNSILRREEHQNSSSYRNSGINDTASEGDNNWAN